MSIELKGNWSKGYALDLHTLSSELTGHDEQGNPQFNTVRSEIGELLYDLKYRNNSNVIPQLIEKVRNCIRGIDKFHYLISVPSSRTDRKFQPVILICQSLSEEYNIPFLQDAVFKTNITKELKTINDIDERKKVLESAITYNTKYDLNGKNVLVVDDLYRSGATLSVVTDVLYKQGKVAKVCVLTLTKTRVNR